VIRRIPRIPFIKRVSPGLSWKKLVCDAFMTTKVVTMAAQSATISSIA
jgi:hypothetical protein